MKTNTKRAPIHTHEGAPAQHLSPEAQLRRSVMSCMLWEKEFYENGQDIAKRIADLVPQVASSKVVAIAVEARSEMNLRHVPLFLIREMTKHEKQRPWVSQALPQVIQRADEITEFLAMYLADNPNHTLANGVKAGLAAAFGKFDAYDFAKYAGTGKQIKMRDALQLAHPKPATEERSKLYRQILEGTLDVFDVLH